jgi:hypothetical protein
LRIPWVHAFKEIEYLSIGKNLLFVSAQAACRARKTLERSLIVVFGSVITRGPIASASDTITGSDISLTANVAYFSNGIKIIYGMNFVGTINSDGSLSLASSQLCGVQDYTFEPTAGAVAQIQSQFQQASCNSR